MTRKKITSMKKSRPASELQLEPKLQQEIVLAVSDLMEKNAEGITEAIESLEEGCTLPVMFTANFKAGGESVQEVEVLCDWTIREKHSDRRKIMYDPTQAKFDTLDAEAIEAQEAAHKALKKAAKATEATEAAEDEN
jgi:hypothetical protein